LDFDEALVNYDLGFEVMVYPLAALKHLGTSVVLNYSVGDLLMGQYAGAIGSTFGIGLIIGGIYLILRGMIRWEISISFLAGVFVTAFFFNIADSEKYAGPLFHLSHVDIRGVRRVPHGSHPKHWRFCRWSSLCHPYDEYCQPASR